MNTQLLIGIGSGIISAIALATAGGGGGGSLLFAFLFMSAPPIAIAGFGWGWRAAFAAMLSAAATLALLVNPQAAGLHLLTIGAPLTALTYLTLLHREIPGPQGRAGYSAPAVEWYPLGRVLSAAALIGGGLASIALMMIGSISELDSLIRNALEWVFSKLPSSETKPPSSEELDKIAASMRPYFGASLATYWILLTIFHLWLAAQVARISGLLERPWPDLSTIQAPKELSAAFAASVLLSFLPDFPGLIASAFASAIILVYMLVGIAILHNVTRGSTFRPVALVTTYAGAIFLQPLSGFALAILALAEPYLPFRRKGPFDANRPPPPPT